LVSVASRDATLTDLLFGSIMRRIASKLLFVLGLLVIGTPLFAQEGEAKPGLLALQGGLMFWTLVIFVLVFIILSKFAFGPITKAVADREQALLDAITAAKKDRDDAAALLAEHRKKIEEARNEAQRFIAEGRAQAEKMKADMLEATHAQQAELMERARRDIDAEKTKAIDELRREAIDLALAGASKVIEKNLDDAQNRKLVESYLSSIK
jgi:F-type H+-transporting ATPase subunit b